MQLSRQLEDRPGIHTAALMMTTPANLELLAGSGLIVHPPEDAKPDDLLVTLVVRAVHEAEFALEWALDRLKRPLSGADTP